MREEEAGLLPHSGQEIVEIVRGRRTGARREAHGGRGVFQETVVLVVDELELLLLLDRLDHQAQLLFELIVRMAVEVRDPGVHPDDGLDRAQHVLPRLLHVVDPRGVERLFGLRRADDGDGGVVVLGAIHRGRRRPRPDPREEFRQPARRDDRGLDDGLVRGGELTCRSVP
jgi:hypothetical protein